MTPPMNDLDPKGLLASMAEFVTHRGNGSYSVMGEHVAQCALDAIAEAGYRVVSADGEGELVEALAKAFHDGPLMADDHEFITDSGQGQWCMEVTRFFVDALSAKAHTHAGKADATEDIAPEPLKTDEVPLSVKLAAVKAYVAVAGSCRPAAMHAALQVALAHYLKAEIQDDHLSFLYALLGADTWIEAGAIWEGNPTQRNAAHAALEAALSGDTL